MKRILKIVLSLILIATFMLPLYVSAEDNEQSNITTYFDEKTGTLTVSGTGKVTGLYSRDDFYEPSEIIIDNEVKHLIIEDGITGIHNAFNDMHALQNVKFPSTLKNLRFSFDNCINLKKVEFKEAIFIIDAFDGSAVEEVYIPDNSTLSFAFNNCKNLKKVVFGKNVTVFSNSYEAEGVYDYDWSFTECHKKLTVYVPERLWHYYKTLPSGTIILLYNPALNWFLIIWCANVILLVPLIIYLKRKRKKS